MLDKYKEKQILFYNFITKCVKDDKLSHAYLIEKNNVSYADSLAIDFAKYLLGADSIVSNLIDEGNYPDVRIIQSEKEIKKDEILELQEIFSSKPLYGKYLIYVIKDASNLNISSANTILKFLEEPSANIIAILLTDNVGKMLDTIVSRCQIISLAREEVNISDIYLKFANLQFSLEDVINFYLNVEKFKQSSIAYSNLYLFKDDIKLLLEVGIYLYVDALNYSKNRNILFRDYEDAVRSLSSNDDNYIMKKIDIIIDYLFNSKFNINKELFLDSFVIALGG